MATPPGEAPGPGTPRVYTFDAIEELRHGPRDFVARHGDHTPNQIRAEQHSLAHRPPAGPPLAA